MPDRLLRDDRIGTIPGTRRDRRGAVAASSRRHAGWRARGSSHGAVYPSRCRRIAGAPNETERVPSMKILVTGGAGFIGSNFVHHVLERHRPHGDRARQAHLRGQPRLARRAARRPVPVRQGRHRGRRARRRALRRCTTRSCTTPPRATTTTRSTTRARSSTRTSSARTRCSRRRARTTSASTTSRPTRSTATSSSTTPRGSPSRHPVQPVEPVLVDEGGQRPARARVGPLVRREGDDLELLEQLRPVPARREVHPAPDHQRAARRAPQALRQGRERARLDPRERPLRRRCSRSSSRGEIGETYLIGADGEKNNKDVVELILDDARPAGRRVRPRGRPPGPRPALRHRLRPGCARSSAGRPRFSDFEAGLADTIAWYRDNEAWWAPQKDATEARYAAQGQ